MASRERQADFIQYPELEEEFSELIGPVQKADSSEKLEELYLRQNPSS
jgi:hypothetical protein